MTDQRLRQAIKGQYHAALAMLGEAIRLCPEELWTVGSDQRTFWQLSYHAVYSAQMYMEQNLEAFVPWEGDRDDIAGLEIGPEILPYTKDEVLRAWERVVSLVDTKIDALDLETLESGFSWYPGFPKLDHVLLSIRHVQEHAGQLRDRLYEAGLDPHWISRGQEPTRGWNS